MEEGSLNQNNKLFINFAINEIPSANTLNIIILTNKLWTEILRITNSTKCFQSAFVDGCPLHQFCCPPDVVGDIVQDDDDEPPSSSPRQPACLQSLFDHIPVTRGRLYLLPSVEAWVQGSDVNGWQGEEGLGRSHHHRLTQHLLQHPVGGRTDEVDNCHKKLFRSSIWYAEYLSSE